MMKTLKDEIAEEVIEEFKKDSSVVGIEICGSLARGEIRADSDIDIEVISENIEKHQFIEEFRQGIKVDISTTPLRVILESVETHPYLHYTSLLTKIVFDPKGILKQIRDRLDLYFDHHPEIAAFWEEKLSQMKAAKMNGEEQEGYRSVLDEAEMKFSDGKGISRTALENQT